MTTKRDDDPKNDESEQRRRRKANLDAAARPTSGASISAAYAGASMGADDDASETETELKKAADKNSRR